MSSGKASGREQAEARAAGLDGGDGAPAAAPPASSAPDSPPAAHGAAISASEIDEQELVLLDLAAAPPGSGRPFSLRSGGGS